MSEKRYTFSKPVDRTVSTRPDEKSFSSKTWYSIGEGEAKAFIKEDILSMLERCLEMGVTAILIGMKDEAVPVSLEYPFAEEEKIFLTTHEVDKIEYILQTKLLFVSHGCTQTENTHNMKRCCYRHNGKGWEYRMHGSVVKGAMENLGI